MDDVVAVMDAAGSERAAVYAQLEGGAMAALFAATHPERTSGARALRGAAADVVGAGLRLGAARRGARGVRSTTASLGRRVADHGARPELSAENPRFRAWFARLERLAASPATAAKLMMHERAGRRAGGAADDPGADARAPPRARTSSSTSATRATSPSTSRARGYVELPGRRGDHVRRRTTAPLLDEIEEFLTGARQRRRDRAHPRHRDVLGHRRLDQRAAELGDRRWRELLESIDGAVGARADALPRPRREDAGRRVPGHVRRPRPRRSAARRRSATTHTRSSGSRSAAACTPGRSR